MTDTVVIAVDIDQTISSGFVGRSVEESIQHYRDRGISIPPDARRYTDFFGLPAVIRIHEHIPGALQGVHCLANRGSVHYFTARKGSGDQDSQNEVEQATYAWLTEHGFPHAEHVVFCQSMVQKLLKLVELHASAERMLLVDDNWAKVLVALQKLCDYSTETAISAQHLCTHLTLVAFGAQTSDLPHEAAVPLIALPQWSDIERLVSVLFEKNKEGSHAISHNSQLPRSYQ